MAQETFEIKKLIQNQYNIGDTINITLKESIVLNELGRIPIYELPNATILSFPSSTKYNNLKFKMQIYNKSEEDTLLLTSHVIDSTNFSSLQNMSPHSVIGVKYDAIDSVNYRKLLDSKTVKSIEDQKSLNNSYFF